MALRVQRGRLRSALLALRGFYDRQLRLQELALQRYEVSGRDAVAATRTLRWVGGELAGDLLPPSGPGRR